MVYLQGNMDRIKAEYLAETYADYKAENEKFLEENKAKEGVKTTESGLQYKVLVEGTGEVPSADARVKVHYKARSSTAQSSTARTSARILSHSA